MKLAVNPEEPALPRALWIIGVVSLCLDCRAAEHFIHPTS